MQKLLTLFVLVPFVVGAVPSLAHAGKRKPIPPDSSVAQYVETVPSAFGGTAPTPTKSGSSSTASVPPAVQKAIQRAGGSDAKALSKLATAGRSSASASSTKSSSPKSKPEKAAPARSAAAAPVVAESGSRSLLWLGALLAALAVTAAGAFVIRRGRTRGPGRPHA